MCKNSGAYFLSRPRRFGKSMTLAVVQELYSGSKELFKGLWIEDKWDWEKKHPVFRISFTSIGFQSIDLSVALVQELEQIAKAKGLQLSTIGAAGMFKELISQLAIAEKVVVLIDEYDAPITHYLGNEVQIAYQNRELLKDFYSVLKDMDSHIELVFITGVSKFSKVGIFSGMNNQTDLTMHPQYATMLGYTQQELEQNFSEEIEDTAAKMNLSRDALIDKMRFWYNGYRFEENAETVYNPVSINNFFSLQKFENFWFETGTPSFLINLLKQEGLYNLSLGELSELDFDGFDLEDLRPSGLLYQTGYLTIKARDEHGFYTLDYPNQEVKSKNRCWPT
jgi:hypothetical protein